MIGIGPMEILVLVMLALLGVVITVIVVANQGKGGRRDE